jgi:hypothetical protein
VKTQQKALYAAQENVMRGRQFTRVDEIQTFVDELRDTYWWQYRYARILRVEVIFRPSGRSLGSYEADKNAGLIELSPQGRCLRTVAHELAHVVAEALYDSKSHDPWFAREYGVLTYHLLGSNAWLTLQRGYEIHHVNYLQDEEEA